MVDPVGPLPASVYWRRRLLAVGVTVLVMFGLLWALTAALLPPGVDSEPGQAAAVEPSPVSPAPGAGADPAVPGTPGAPLAGAPPGTALGAPTGPAVPNAGPVDENLRPMPGGPPVVGQTGAPLPPTGPAPCADGMIRVSAETGAPEYRAGSRPVLRLVVTNTSPQPCVRDLDGALQEIAVWSGDGVNRLWSSNDCVNPGSADLRTLIPGQPVAFAVNWSGLGSVPGCSAERDRIPPGAYRVLTRLGPVLSAPVPLLLSP